MDPRLATALHLVLADLAATGLPAPAITDTAASSREQPEALLTAADGTGMGVSILTDADDTTNLVRVADGVQEFVHEHLQWPAGTPVAWPVCPDHPHSHPLAATVATTAVWACPSSHRVIVAIGALATVNPAL